MSHAQGSAQQHKETYQSQFKWLNALFIMAVNEKVVRKKVS